MTRPSSATRWRRAASIICVAALSFAPLSGCADPDQASERATRDAELLARSLAVAIEAADSALVRDLFWPQATYDDFPNQHSYQGIDEIVGYLTGVHVWADDILMNVGSVHPTSTGGVVLEWLFSGRQVRPIPGQLSTATGNEVVLNGVTVLEVEGGRIVRAADYTDTAAMLLQLGAVIEMPDGTTFRLR